MKCSFIDPIYKTAFCMRKCVDSILNQSYGDLKLILVNDGSSDKAAQICEYEQDEKNSIQELSTTTHTLRKKLRRTLSMVTK